VTIDETQWQRHPGPPLGRRFLLPLAVAMIQIVGTHFAALRQAERLELDGRGILLLGLGPAALVLRRRYPVAVLGFVLATTLGYLLLGYPRGPIFIALIVAFLSAVMSGHRAAAVMALLFGYPSFLWLPNLVLTEPPPTLGQALGAAAWLFVVLAGAEIARSRRERALEFAHQRAEEARHRAGEERLRIAR
jgi:signal transduction histidine kinase